jgi:hypothetical protein
MLTNNKRAYVSEGDLSDKGKQSPAAMIVINRHVLIAHPLLAITL